MSRTFPSSKESSESWNSFHSRLKLLSTQEGKPFEELLGGNTSWESTNLSNLGVQLCLGHRVKLRVWKPMWMSIIVARESRNPSSVGGHIGSLAKWFWHAGVHHYCWGVHATIKAVVLETHHWHITHRDNQQQLAIYILIVVSQSAAMSTNWKFKLDARIIWYREGRVFVWHMSTLGVYLKFQCSCCWLAAETVGHLLYCWIKGTHNLAGTLILYKFFSFEMHLIKTSNCLRSFVVS